MKNVSGKTVSNNCAECAWEIGVLIYTKYVWENDLACYFKNLLMLCYVFTTYITNIIMKTLNENEFTYLPLTLKRLEGGGGNLTPRPRVVFQKLYLLNRGWNPGFFVTFKIMIRHIFPENIIEIPQVVQMLWRISVSTLAIFINFYQFFGFLDISLLQRN